MLHPAAASHAAVKCGSEESMGQEIKNQEPFTAICNSAGHQSRSDRGDTSIEQLQPQPRHRQSVSPNSLSTAADVLAGRLDADEDSAYLLLSSNATSAGTKEVLLTAQQ